MVICPVLLNCWDRGLLLIPEPQESVWRYQIGWHGENGLENLGLGEAAKRDVGTGDNRYRIWEHSLLVRDGSGYQVDYCSVWHFFRKHDPLYQWTLPIPFPNQPMVSVSVMSDAVQ